jgi:hypothetical protein
VLPVMARYVHRNQNKNCELKPGIVAQACNPSYLKGSRCVISSQPMVSCNGAPGIPATWGSVNRRIPRQANWGIK